MQITAKSLSKTYGSFTAVDRVDLMVQTGQCLGVVGRNGAGKSSLMKMLSTVSKPSSGSLNIFGLSSVTHASEIKMQLGIVPQLNTLDEELTVRQNIEVYGRYFGLSRSRARKAATSSLSFAGLTEKESSAVNALSGGMKRRLTIARALVNNPKILLLDEPTTALDTQSKHAVWAALSSFKNEGKTIVLLSHDMEEVERLCDYVLVMHDGRFLASGTPEELIKKFCRPAKIDIVMQGGHEVDWGVVFQDRSVAMSLTARGVIGEVRNGEESMSLLRQSAITFTAATVRPTSLEDVFLRLTGRLPD
jgi:lipooligosaccharide transport system ATP-binding protein